MAVSLGRVLPVSEMEMAVNNGLSSSWYLGTSLDG